MVAHVSLSKEKHSRYGLLTVPLWMGYPNRGYRWTKQIGTAIIIERVLSVGFSLLTPVFGSVSIDFIQSGSKRDILPVHPRLTVSEFQLLIQVLGVFYIIFTGNRRWRRPTYQLPSDLVELLIKKLQSQLRTSLITLHNIIYTCIVQYLNQA